MNWLKLGDWTKVVTDPLGLVGFALLLVFAVAAPFAHGRRRRNRWILPGFYALAAVGVLGAFAVAYVRVARTGPPQRPTSLVQQVPHVAVGIIGDGNTVTITPPAKGDTKASQRLVRASNATSQSGLGIGNDSVAMGRVPPGTRIGDRSVVVGPTDADGNTVLNRGGLAVGKGAKADSTSIAIGAGANAGQATTTGSVVAQPGSVVSIGQQGGQTAGTIINNGPPPPPTPTVAICISQLPPENGKHRMQLIFNTSESVMEPWYALYFDRPVLDGFVSFADGTGAFAYTHDRTRDQPANSFLFRVSNVDFGPPRWKPGRALRALIPSETKVHLTKILTGSGELPFLERLEFPCGGAPPESK